MYVCFLCILGIVLIRNIIDQRIPYLVLVILFDCLCSCDIDPVQRTKGNLKKKHILLAKSFCLVFEVGLLLVIVCVFVVGVCFVVCH